MNQNTSQILKVSTPSDSKKVSFLDQQSLATNSTRKKYLLKKSRLSIQAQQTHPTNKSNIFDLTSGMNRAYSQINSNTNSVAESRLYTNSLFQSPSKDSLFENPQKRAVLPIITQSKYNFKPSIAFPKIKLQQYPQKAPFYVKNATKVDHNNIKKMKRYKKNWAQSCMFRGDMSLLDRSTQKAQKYIQKHNKDILQRKASIEFETILRNRHIQQQSRIGTIKGVPKRSLQGLKGKGGSVRSLFQEMYAIQQIYKIDK